MQWPGTGAGCAAPQATTPSFRRKPESTRTEAVAWPPSARAHVGQRGMAAIVDPGFRRDDGILSTVHAAVRQPKKATGPDRPVLVSSQWPLHAAGFGLQPT
jgi:hypothetical protein